MPRKALPADAVAPLSTLHPPLPPSPIVQALRKDWRWAGISQFVWTFSDAFGLVDWDIESLEADFDGDETRVVPTLIAKLLFALTYNRQINRDNAFDNLRKQYIKRRPEANPLGTEEEPKEWATLGLGQKVGMLWDLCEWQLEDPARFRGLLKSEDEAASWRVDPIGWDKAGNTYFLFDDNRLWVQRLPPPPPRPPKKTSMKAKRALKRSRPSTTNISTPASASASASASTSAARKSHRKRERTPSLTPPPREPEDVVLSGSRRRNQVQFYGNPTPTAQALKRGLATPGSAPNGTPLSSSSSRPTRSSVRHAPLPAESPSKSSRAAPPLPLGTRISRRLRHADEDEHQEDGWQKVPEEWLSPVKGTATLRKGKGRGKRASDESESELSELTDEDEHEARLRASGAAGDPIKDETMDGVENGLKVAQAEQVGIELIGHTDDGESGSRKETNGHESHLTDVGAQAKSEAEAQDGKLQSVGSNLLPNEDDPLKAEGSAKNETGFVEINGTPQGEDEDIVMDDPVAEQAPEAKAGVEADAEVETDAKAEEGAQAEIEGVQDGADEADADAEDDVKAAVKEANDLPEGFVEWEAVCVTLYDWRTWPEQFAKSRDPDEKALYLLLTEEVGPTIIDVLMVKEQERLKQEAINNRKRSSRIATRELEKEEAARHEQAQREMEERMERTRLEEQRKAREAADALAKERAREDRVREREGRIAAREEALAKKAEEEARVRERAERLREKRKRRREGEQVSDDEDDEPTGTRGETGTANGSASRAVTPGAGSNGNGDQWELDCEVCKKNGWNIDGDLDLVSCDDCGRWQHVECHDMLDEREGRGKRDWDQVDFKCKDCRRRAARKRQHFANGGSDINSSPSGPSLLGTNGHADSQHPFNSISSLPPTVRPAPTAASQIPQILSHSNPTTYPLLPGSANGPSPPYDPSHPPPPPLREGEFYTPIPGHHGQPAGFAVYYEPGQAQVQAHGAPAAPTPAAVYPSTALATSTSTSALAQSMPVLPGGYGIMPSPRSAAAVDQTQQAPWPNPQSSGSLQPQAYFPTASHSHPLNRQAMPMPMSNSNVSSERAYSQTEMRSNTAPMPHHQLAPNASSSSPAGPAQNRTSTPTSAPSHPMPNARTSPQRPFPMSPAPPGPGSGSDSASAAKATSPPRVRGELDTFPPSRSPANGHSHPPHVPVPSTASPTPRPLPPSQPSNELGSPSPAKNPAFTPVPLAPPLPATAPAPASASGNAGVIATARLYEVGVAQRSPEHPPPRAVKDLLSDD